MPMTGRYLRGAPDVLCEIQGEPASLLGSSETEPEGYSSSRLNWATFWTNKLSFPVLATLSS